MAEIPVTKMIQWRTNPVEFVREVFHVEPDDWQKDVLTAFVTNNRIAMKAAKGVGKSTILAWLAWNFLLTRPEPKIAATSISWDNLADNLWTEMAKWQGKSPLLQAEFQWTKTRIFLKRRPETWWMSARTWSKSADSQKQADTLAGLHADYLLFLIDEVGGIPDAIMATAEAALASGIETKIAMAGNPTQTSGPLYRACVQDKKLWYVVEISSGPDDPKRSPRVSKQWAQDQIDKWGADNPWVLVNVFGKFPPTSFNSLLGIEEVEESMRRNIHPEVVRYAQKRMGVDVARFGSDSSVIIPRQGLIAYAPVVMRNARSNEIAARVIAGKYKWGSEVEYVDGTGGYGSGVIDSMLQAGGSPVEVQFAGRPDDERYFNRRSEMWFRMAEWVKRGGQLPRVDELKRELTEPVYYFSGSGKFQLEPKELIKERLGYSPDVADALAMTFYHAESEGMGVMGLGREMGVENVTDWDPFV